MMLSDTGAWATIDLLQGPLVQVVVETIEYPVLDPGDGQEPDTAATATLSRSGPAIRDTVVTHDGQADGSSASCTTPLTSPRSTTPSCTLASARGGIVASPAVPYPLASASPRVALTPAARAPPWRFRRGSLATGLRPGGWHVRDGHRSRGLLSTAPRMGVWAVERSPGTGSRSRPEATWWCHEQLHDRCCAARGRPRSAPRHPRPGRVASLRRPRRPIRRGRRWRSCWAAQRPCVNLAGHADTGSAHAADSIGLPEHLRAAAATAHRLAHPPAH